MIRIYSWVIVFLYVFSSLIFPREIQFTDIPDDAKIKIDDLIEEVWGESADLTNPPVRIHIANLRKKIGDSDYRIIRTIPILQP